jgi:hypothetical protein
MQIGAKVPPRLRVSRNGYETIEVDGAKLEHLDLAQYDHDPRLNPHFEGPFYLRTLSIKRISPEWTTAEQGARANVLLGHASCYRSFDRMKQQNPDRLQARVVPEQAVAHLWR